LQNAAFALSGSFSTPQVSRYGGKA